MAWPPLPRKYRALWGNVSTPPQERRRQSAGGVRVVRLLGKDRLGFCRGQRVVMPHGPGRSGIQGASKLIGALTGGEKVAVGHGVDRVVGQVLHVVDIGLDNGEGHFPEGGAGISR